LGGRKKEKKKIKREKRERERERDVIMESIETVSNVLACFCTVNIR
jgi:hypothetical protein